MRLQSKRKLATPRLEVLEDRLVPSANFAFQQGNWNMQENWGLKSITVVRDGDLSSPMTVDLSSVAGSAQPGLDYQSLQATLAFDVGETSKTVNLHLIDDSVWEDVETLNLILSNPTGGATLGALSSSVVNIADNDPQPGSGATFKFYYDQWNAQENWGFKQITVQRVGDLSSAMTVDVATVAGSALPGQDYQPVQTTLTFGVGESTRDFNLYLVNDTVIESQESLTVVLSNPTGSGAALGASNTAVVNIIDDDASFSFYYDHWNTQENWGYASINVIRHGYTGTTMTVDLSTVAGSAQPGQDYQPLQTTLTFGVGETSKWVNLSLVNDNVVEGMETLNVVLSNPTGGAKLGPISTAVVNIANDDIAAPGTIQFSYQTLTTNEGWGYAILYVSRSGGSTGEVSVDYTIANGTAQNGSDFNASNGTLVFADGETTRTIIVSLVNDGLVEGMESLSAVLSNPLGGATLGEKSTAVLNILDDDV